MLVHGDKNEMSRLRQALVDKYEPEGTQVLAPRNCQTVKLGFKSEKMCRVIGTIADRYQDIVIRADESERKEAEAATNGTQGNFYLICFFNFPNHLQFLCSYNHLYRANNKSG